MEYAVKAETKEGDVIILRRGFPSRSDAEDHPVRLSLWKRVWVERVLETVLAGPTERADTGLVNLGSQQ
jgi:hypothetical protein